MNTQHRIAVAGLALATTLTLVAPARSRDTYAVSQVRILGNQAVKTYVIRREIPFGPGDMVGREEYNAARSRVRRLPGIDYAEFNAIPTGPDSALVLNVFVTEKSTAGGAFRIERGYENDMSYGLRLTTRNFRGRNETVEGSFLLRGNQIYELRWENPWVGSPHRIGLGLRASYARYEYPYTDAGETLSGADIDRAGAELSTFLSGGGPSRLSLALGFESVGGDDPVTADGDRDAYFSAGVTALLDGRDSRKYPFSGVYLEATARRVGFGDDSVEFFRGTLDARAYYTIAGRSVIAAQARADYRDGDAIPVYHRAHVGGSKTLRGYEFGSFNGVSSAIASAEYRLPLNFTRAQPMESVLLGIELHGFADTGAAWERGEDVETDRFYTTYGVGAAFLNRNFAAFRVDYGWPLADGDGRWEFDMGLRF